MNERIEELIAKASSWVEVDCEFGTDSEYQLDAKKFAELIVKECMELTKRCSTGKGIHDLFADEIIKQHFGVE